MRLTIAAAALVGIYGCSSTSTSAPSPLPALPPVQSTPHRAAGSHGYETLHIFSGGATDGAYPNGGLSLSGGTLYGTTAGGGWRSEGTVYTTTTAGSVDVLYIFGTSSDSYGDSPDAAPIMVNGMLFGTTEGGTSGASGTLFGISYYGREPVQYALYGEYGANPYDGVIYVGGKLYCTTSSGGAYGDGTVVAVDPSSSYAYYPTLIYSFGAASGDGANPMAGLIYQKGKFYGTTYNGGANNAGTVFSLTPSGTEQILHSFGASGDGANPRGALLHYGNLFYGTTVSGGANGYGTVYAISASGHEKVLHSFGGPPDGVAPYDQLTAYRGALYGTTYDGGSGGCGSSNGCGTVFKMTTKGNLTVLHSFTSNPDGAHPWAGLVVAKSGMYGTATLGGSGVGTIFRISR